MSKQAKYSHTYYWKDIEKSRAKNRVKDLKRRESRILYMKRYNAENKEYFKKYREEHKVQLNARYKLRAAVKAGKLTKLPCEVCGEWKSEGHHDDCLKPLVVKWFCRIHHVEVHRIIRLSKTLAMVGGLKR